MEIAHRTALVTGGNRGIGRELVRQLLERGASTVYAAARRPETVDIPGAVPIRLDVTDPGQVKAAVDRTGDVDLLVNNAGVATFTDLLAGDLGAVHREMDVHFWGTLGVIRAFAPVLVRNGGGGIVNLLSTLALRTYPGSGAYAAAKAAEWSLTDSVRVELAPQGTQVLGAFLAGVDTEMMAAVDGPKAEPTVVVRDILDALEAGRSEYFDDTSASAKRELSLSPAERFPWLIESRPDA